MSLSDERLPSLPSHADYFAAVRDLDNDFHAGIGPRLSIRDFIITGIQKGDKGLQDLVEIAANVASVLNPIDRSTGEPLMEQDEFIVNSFTHGIVAGAMIVKQVHKGLISSADILNDTLDFTISRSDDDPHDRYMTAENVMELGRRGLALMGGSAEGVVESWEPDISPDVREQRMTRTGCGFAVLGAYGLHQKLLQEESIELELSNFENNIDSFDWAKGE